MFSELIKSKDKEEREMRKLSLILCAVLLIFGVVSTANAESLCQGDFDHDGDVNGSDLTIIASEFGRSDCSTNVSPSNPILKKFYIETYGCIALYEVPIGKTFVITDIITEGLTFFFEDSACSQKVAHYIANMYDFSTPRVPLVSGIPFEGGKTIYLKPSGWTTIVGELR